MAAAWGWAFGHSTRSRNCQCPRRALQRRTPVFTIAGSNRTAAMPRQRAAGAGPCATRLEVHNTTASSEASSASLSVSAPLSTALLRHCSYCRRSAHHGGWQASGRFFAAEASAAISQRRARVQRLRARALRSRGGLAAAERRGRVTWGAGGAFGGEFRDCRRGEGWPLLY